MKWKLILLIIVINTNYACFKRNNQDEWDRQNMRNIVADDARLERAINNAQMNFPIFINSFEDNKFNAEFQFFVKSQFKYHDYVEHMWGKVINISEAKDKMTIILDNQPYLTNISLGDTLNVFINDLEDFMIFK